MAFWSNDHAKEQLSFLGRIDPRYFQYINDTNLNELNGPNDNHAAMMLRANYSHALETLFALVMASAQAPHCPLGWMLCYSNPELNALVEVVSQYGTYDELLGTSGGGWEKIAELTTLHEIGTNHHELTSPATSLLWKNMARDFLNAKLQLEYNNIKHGLRISPSNYYLAMGFEDSPGVPAPPERMRVMSRSKHGSTFVVPSRVKVGQFTFKEQRVNWRPSEFVRRMPFLVASMLNLIAFLKIWNGSPAEEIKVRTFTLEDVETALEHDGPPPGWVMDWNPNIKPGDVTDLSAAEMLEEYRQNAASEK